MVKETKTRNTKRSPDVVARDYTVNLHKRLHGRYPFFPTISSSCIFVCGARREGNPPNKHYSLAPVVRYRRGFVSLLAAIGLLYAGLAVSGEWMSPTAVRLL
jgi:hypothetical protein